MTLKSVFVAALAPLTLSTTLLFSQVTTAAEVPPGTKLAETQHLTRGIGAEPSSLDPHLVSGTPGGFVVRDLFEGLTTEDPDGKIIPGQAERWTISDDKKVYTFYLRKNLKWSNGDPVTAHDFVFSFRRAVDPNLASPYSWYIELIGIKNANEALRGKVKPDTIGVKGIDDMTLEITLNQPTPYFTKTLAHYTTYPVHQATVKKFGKKWTLPKNIVSNGPYKLTKWVVNERIESKRNPHYWDNKKTVIDRVTYYPIESSNTELDRYRAGELDITHTIAENHYKKLKKTIPDEVKTHGIVATYYYTLNLLKKPFDDVRVRKALSLAVDRDIIAKKVLGLGEIPAYNYIPPYVDGYEAVDSPYANMTQEERIKLAQKYLKEAGITEKNPLKFQVIYNTLEAHKKVAIALYSMWQKNLKHVKVEILNQEWKTFLTNKEEGNFVVARDGWNGDYNEASTMLSTLLSYSKQNYGRWNNKTFDQLFTKASVADNPSLYYQKAEKLIQEEMPIIPLYYYVSKNLVKPSIGGFTNRNPLDNFLSKDLYKIQL
ncbi:peptide ABC transporter substrate-binding protein [Zooshikella ganghwensis]|uniref:peptide ABC transporter substrate-binding protein n=1 Tax=Zooshikella ganghwensis TaxID=202772 RepID=UPI000421F79F|nr:peptide ABC transporter substrate-binding protein [Zooshikella ganghwensis]